MAKVTSSDDTTPAVGKAGVEKSGKNAGKKSKKAKKAKQALSEAEEQLAKALKQVEKLRSTVELLEGKRRGPSCGCGPRPVRSSSRASRA